MSETATLSNTPGMGDVSMPTSSEPGSGDVTSSNGKKKKKRFLSYKEFYEVSLKKKESEEE